MRPVTSIVVALAIAGSASTATAQQPADDPPAEATAPTPTILHADEGEKLLMFGDRYVILKATAEGTGARELLLGSEALPPGSAIPVHSHDGYEEIIFIHEGTVRLTLGDRVVEAGPGTTMFVPPGTWHGVEAYGDAEATMLFIFPETDIAEFFRVVGYEEGAHLRNSRPRTGAGSWSGTRCAPGTEGRARSGPCPVPSSNDDPARTWRRSSGSWKQNSADRTN